MFDSDTAALVIGRPGQGSLTLGMPSRAADGSGMRVPIRIQVSGVDARSEMDLESWNGGAGRFCSYLDDLASSWRGWAGIKEFWDDGANLKIASVHDRVGQVILSVTLSPHAGLDQWQLQVGIPIEPGTLQALAEAVRAFLV